MNDCTCLACVRELVLHLAAAEVYPRHFCRNQGPPSFSSRLPRSIPGIDVASEVHPPLSPPTSIPKMEHQGGAYDGIAVRRGNANAA